MRATRKPRRESVLTGMGIVDRVARFVIILPLVWNVRDEERQCHELDDDALLERLEPLLAGGGAVLDHHVADLYPPEWFDLVVVLRMYSRVPMGDGGI